MHQAESFGEAVRPFEVVEQRPREVAADVRTLANRVVNGAQMLAQVVDTQRIVERCSLDTGGSKNAAPFSVMYTGGLP